MTTTPVTKPMTNRLVSLRRVALALLLLVAACATGEAPDVFTDGAPAEPDGGLPLLDAAPAIDALIDAVPCVPQLTGERCNGFDDDCDGEIDDGFPGVGDECYAGVGGCARAGREDCTPDGLMVLCSAIAGAPSEELCGNALDDDCDGESDEGFPGVGDPCTDGVGGCARAGTMGCDAAGLAVVCDVVAGTPEGERCGNAVDDDCDGETDEGFPDFGGPCAAGMGACQRSGTMVCDAAGLSTTCNAVEAMPAPEACNGIDDDCDGSADEDFGLSMPCDGADGDLCPEGTTICNSTGATVCSDSSATSVDLCNGVDDDCSPGTPDGASDPALGAVCDGPDGDFCVEGSILCSAGTLVCSDFTSTTFDLCGNGLDEDCSGADLACAGPANDGPSGAIDISAGGSFFGDLGSASNDLDGGCGGSGGHDLFYTFILGGSEVVYFDTFGSSIDTVLHLYPGPCTARGAQTFCQDDSCSTLQTQRTASLAPGTYCLVADQFAADATGTLTLRFVRGGRVGANIPATPGDYAGTTAGAANLTYACIGDFAPEVAYYFTLCPADTKLFSATTCSRATWDTGLYVVSGSGLSGTLLGCNDDSCSVQTTVSATISGAGLYWLMVDGYSAASGPYTVAVTM